jgi:hypothetical protein
MDLFTISLSLERSPTHVPNDTALLASYQRPCYAYLDGDHHSDRLPLDPGS